MNPAHDVFRGHSRKCIDECDVVASAAAWCTLLCDFTGDAHERGGKHCRTEGRLFAGSPYSTCRLI